MRCLLYGLALCCLLAVPEKGNAGISWSFKLAAEDLRVSGTDTVSVYGSIFNSPLSDQALTIARPCDECDSVWLGVLTSSTLFDYYSLDEGPVGPGDLTDSLTGITLEPGYGVEFLFYSLVPTSALAPSGSYLIEYNSVYLFCAKAGFFDCGFSPFVPLVVTVLPEPASIWISLTGLAALALALRQRGLRSTRAIALHQAGYA